MPILGKGRFDDPAGIIPGDITVQGNLTVTGSVIQEGDETVSGNETVTGDLAVGGDATVSGDLIADVVGKTLNITAGANGKGGTVTLNGATPVSVANTSITAGSIVIFTLKTVGGTVGAYPAIQTITPTTGFDVAGTAGDTSVYNYAILELI